MAQLVVEQAIVVVAAHADRLDPVAGGHAGIARDLVSLVVVEEEKTVADVCLARDVGLVARAAPVGRGDALVVVRGVDREAGGAERSANIAVAARAVRLREQTNEGKGYERLLDGDDDREPRCTRRRDDERRRHEGGDHQPEKCRDPGSRFSDQRNDGEQRERLEVCGLREVPPQAASATGLSAPAGMPWGSRPAR